MNSRGAVWALAMMGTVAVACAGGSSLNATPPSGDDGGGGGTFGDGGAMDCSATSTNYTGCPCVLGDHRSCYTGPPGTRDVGLCKDGTQTCVSTQNGEFQKGTYGDCQGETLPSPPVCDGLDHACNNTQNLCTDGGPQPQCSLAAPRLVAPLSTARATSRQPNLRWELASGTDGVVVQLCKDRGCNSVLQTMPFKGASGTVPNDLPPGVVFWRAVSTMGTQAIGCTLSPTWEFFVNARSAPVNTSWGTVLDVNGDGYADAATVGVSGTVEVHLGSAGGLTGAAAAKLTVSASRVANAGDVNGDGFGDLIVSDANSGGDVYLGGPNGIAPAPSSTATVPNESYSGFEPAGDVNGDGYADIIASAGSATGYSPDVCVFHGGPSGLATAPSETLTAPEETHWVAGAGDVNGDQYADVIVGTAGAHAGDGSQALDQAFVYHGSASGLQVLPATTLTTPLVSYSEGALVDCAGDVNGDGYADVLLSDEGQYGDYVDVFLGSSGGVAPTPSVTLTAPGSAQEDEFGSCMTALDVNGDGYWDVAVGEYSAGIHIFKSLMG